MGHSPWGCKALDMTEPLTLHYLASTDSNCSEHPYLGGRSLGFLSRSGIAGFHGLSLHSAVVYKVPFPYTITTLGFIQLPDVRYSVTWFLFVWLAFP